MSNVNCLKKSIFFKDEIVIFSSSNEGRILLWKYDKMKRLFNQFLEINIHNKIQNDLVIEGLEESIKYHQLICGTFIEKRIYFFDLYDFSKKGIININVNRCIRALKILKDDILIVAGNKEIYVLI